MASIKLFQMETDKMICTFCQEEITQEEVKAGETTLASIDVAGNYELCHTECLEETRSNN